MPQINYGICNHKIPAILAKKARCMWPKKDHLDDCRCSNLRAAMTWIQRNIIDGTACYITCEEAFKALPGGRTFSEMWNDPDIWISFLQTPDITIYGEAVYKGKDMAVSYGSFKHGWKMVAATIVHELAHLNGAPSNTKDAESVLLHCGLEDEHRDDIIGYLRKIPKGAIRYA